jgi:hypothetical protein
LGVRGALRIKTDLVSLSLIAFGKFEIVNCITTVILWKFLLSETMSFRGIYRKEGLVVGIVGLFAYDNGGLVIIQFEDDEFGSFA